MDSTPTTLSVRDLSIELLDRFAKIDLEIANQLRVVSIGTTVSILPSDILQSCAQKMRDESGRFRIWAANVGATQTRQNSLEVRLGQTRNITINITQSLSNLCKATDTFIQISSGKKPLRITDRNPNVENDPGDISDSASETSSTSPTANMESNEIDILVRKISEAITNLMRISIAVRSMSRRDQYAKSTAVLSRYPYPTEFDIRRVLDLFPKLQNTEWLAEKLGEAVVRRRQHFKYREDRHGRLMMQLQSTDTADDTRSQFSRASTFDIGVQDHSVVDDQLSVGARSNTTYGDANAEINNRLPHIPRALNDGDPGECPLCFNIVTIQSKWAWRQHVFNDLRPYVCVFPACDVPIFASRQLWFDHELVAHRLVRSCVFCNSHIRSREEMLLHLRGAHRDSYITSQEAAVMDSCDHINGQLLADTCPLCDDFNIMPPGQDNHEVTQMVDFRRLRSHLGEHLQLIALASLPVLDDDDARSELDVVGEIPSPAQSEGDVSGDISPAQSEGALFNGPSSPGSTTNESQRLGRHTVVSYSISIASSDSLLDLPFTTSDDVNDDDDDNDETASNAVTDLQLASQDYNNDPSNMLSLPSRDADTLIGHLRGRTDVSEKIDLVDSFAMVPVRSPADDFWKAENLDHLKQYFHAVQECNVALEKANECHNRVRHQMLDAGYGEKDIDAVLDVSIGETSTNIILRKRNEGYPRRRPIYPRVRRIHVSEETLRAFGYNWEPDLDDPDYIIIVHELSEEETDELFRHTRQLQKQHEEYLRRRPVEHAKRRPVYPRVRRIHVSEETLKTFGYNWETDRNDPDYIIILHELNTDQTDELFEHTERLLKKSADQSGSLLGASKINFRPFAALARRRAQKEAKNPAK